MKSSLKTTSLLAIAAIILNACSSNQAESGLKTKTDLYLLNRMQETTMSIYEMSENRSMDLKEAYFTEPDKEKKKRLNELVEMGQHFDSVMEKLIHKIETAKLEMVKQTGSDLNASGTIKYQPQSIVSKYPLVNADPNKTISVTFDFTKFGKEQYDLMIEFRENVLSTLLDNTISSDNKPFTFNDPDIRIENAGSTDVFYKSVDKSFNQMKINFDDVEMSKTIYIMATPNISFYNEAFKEDISWIEKFSLLEDQKQKLLEIRRFFYSLIASKINLAKMVDFNSIVAVAEGDEYVKGGSEQIFKVFIAGINTLEHPTLTVAGNSTIVEVKNGVAKVKVVVPKGASECEYGGTISIRDKTGQIIERPWSKKFVISKEK